MYTNVFRLFTQVFVNCFAYDLERRARFLLSALRSPLATYQVYVDSDHWRGVSRTPDREQYMLLLKGSKIEKKEH